MTKDEKKERRELRRKLYAACEKNITLDAKLTATPRQVKQYTRLLADQILAGKNPHLVRTFNSETYSPAHRNGFADPRPRDVRRAAQRA